MKDEVLDSFVKEMLKEEIDNVQFKQYIKMFSRFLGYTNLEYKYNGTYLEQYISDFMQVYKKLKSKNEKYEEIFIALLDLKKSFELLIDQSFCVSHLLNLKLKSGYISINKAKITSSGIEIKVKMELENKEYVFCKAYENFCENKLSEKISSDVREYIEMKMEGNNETS